MPHSSPSGTPIAWKKTSTSRGVGAAPDVDGDRLVEAEHRAQARRTAARSPSAAVRRDVVGHRLAGLLELDLAPGGVEPADRLLALRARDAPPGPALSFSKMRGTAKNHVGLTAGR